MPTGYDLDGYTDDLFCVKRCAKRTTHETCEDYNFRVSQESVPMHTVRIMSLVDQMRASAPQTAERLMLLSPCCTPQWHCGDCPRAHTNCTACTVSVERHRRGKFFVCSVWQCSYGKRRRDHLSGVYRSTRVQTFDIAQLATLFFTVTAGAHAYYAWRHLIYEQMIAQQLNWWRWVEYSLRCRQCSSSSPC